MSQSKVEDFLKSIKGNTYRIEGERVRVESTSIHPKTGRVMITTNRWTRFWYKGNNGFKALFTEPVKPAGHIKPVVVREVKEETAPEPPKVYLRRSEGNELAVTEQPAQPVQKPTVLKSAFNPAKPKKHSYIRNRVLDLMKLRGYSIGQLAYKMGLDYPLVWNTLATCQNSISLGRLQELACALQVSLPYLVSSEPITNQSIELHTINYTAQ